MYQMWHDVIWIVINNSITWLVWIFFITKEYTIEASNYFFICIMLALSEFIQRTRTNVRYIVNIVDQAMYVMLCYVFRGTSLSQVRTGGVGIRQWPLHSTASCHLRYQRFMQCRCSSASGGYGLLAPSDLTVICSAKPLRNYLPADFIKPYINKLIYYLL